VERRGNPRKVLDPIHVANVYAVDRMLTLVRYGTIRNASATGLLIEVQREDLSPEFVEHDLTLEDIIGDVVSLTIDEMELALDAKITRAREVDASRCEIAVDFAEYAPAYWRESLAELLPSLGEMGGE
jgi:hypothetical protein